MRNCLAKRVMFFYFGNQFGQASAKLLAYGILHMRGLSGKPGWFYLFVVRTREYRSHEHLKFFIPTMIPWWCVVIHIENMLISLSRS
jgi:hypothetical protein